MAIIQCPECGHEISDQSEQCIYCGFPIQKQLQQKILYDILFNGFINKYMRNQYFSFVSYILIHLFDDCNAIDTADIMNRAPIYIFDAITKENAIWVKNFLQTYGCDIQLTKSKYQKPSQDNITLSKYSSTNTETICPYCGAITVASDRRGFSLITGFIGSNKTILRCAKCGNTWKFK